MAWDLSGTSQYFELGSAITSTEPFTLAGWGNQDANGGDGLISIERASGNNHRHTLRFNGNGTVTAQSRDTATGSATTAATITVGQWHHLCGIFTASDSRRVVLDGDWAGSATDTTSVSPTSLADTRLGTAIAAVGELDGKIAECAIWNVALAQSDVEALADKVSPLLVRPDALLGYWPLNLNTDPVLDIVGGNNMAHVGTPTFSVHPAIIYATGSVFPLDLTAVVGANPKGPFGHPFYGGFRGPFA